MLAGLLYFFAFSDTQDISNLGTAKTVIEKYFVEENLYLTVQDLVISEIDSTYAIQIKIDGELTEEQVQELENSLEEKMKKEITLTY